MSSRHQWTQTLERYINNKLADRSQKGTPLVLTNSQFLIDGIVLAINDHPQEYRESHIAVQNIILSRSNELVNGQKDTASAALALYVAWCLYDGMLKGCAITELHALVSESLPSLVAAHMPIYFPAGTDRRRQAEAASEYGQLYWHMIQSWLSGSVVAYSVIDKCTATLNQQIALYESEAPPRIEQQQADVSKESFVKVLSGLTSVQIAKASGAGAIAATMNDFYGLGKGSHLCTSCGAGFASTEALTEHREYHRYLVSQPRRPLWRLLAPSSDSFVHFGKAGTDGTFPKVAGVQADISSNPSAARINLPRI